MSFSTILSAVIEGLEVAFIHVEADISNGLPVFHMVGYLSSEVKEAGERVRTAIKNSGFEYPAKRTVVNLSPATMRKHGASFDLPIAAAILTALGQIEKPEKDCRRTQSWRKCEESVWSFADRNGSERKRGEKVYCSV